MLAKNADTRALLSALFGTLENDILPKTRDGVAAGNKIFGAALLRKSDYSLVLAETNNETENPLWHGEVHCLKRFYEMPTDTRPATSDLIFLSTHEPCSMCLSAITCDDGHDCGIARTGSGGVSGKGQINYRSI